MVPLSQQIDDFPNQNKKNYKFKRMNSFNQTNLNNFFSKQRRVSSVYPKEKSIENNSLTSSQANNGPKKNIIKEIYHAQMKQKSEFGHYINHYNHEQKKIFNSFQCPICRIVINNYGNNSSLNRHIDQCMKNTTRR